MEGNQIKPFGSLTRHDPRPEENAIPGEQGVITLFRMAHIFF